MSDGRNFTDYRPNYELNNTIIKENNITNSHNYNNFLKRNTEKLIENNRRYIASKNQLYNCKTPYVLGTMVPDKSKVSCNAHVCKRTLNDKNGLGEGRVYNTGYNKILSPLEKPEYVFDNNVCASPGDSFNYQPIDANNRNKILRNAVSGGGEMLSGGDSDIIS